MQNNPSETKRRVTIYWRGKDTTSDGVLVNDNEQKGFLEFSKCAHHVKGAMYTDYGKMTIKGQKTDNFDMLGMQLADEYEAYGKEHDETTRNENSHRN